MAEVFILYLQIDALGTVDDLEVENLAKVDPEIGAQGASVRSGHFFAVVQDLDEKRAPRDIFSSRHFSPERGTQQT